MYRILIVAGCLLWIATQGNANLQAQHFSNGYGYPTGSQHYTTPGYHHVPQYAHRGTPGCQNSGHAGNGYHLGQPLQAQFVVRENGQEIFVFEGTYEELRRLYPGYAARVTWPPSGLDYYGNGFRPARPVKPGYDKFGNPLPRKISDVYPPRKK